MKREGKLEENRGRDGDGGQETEGPLPTGSLLFDVGWRALGGSKPMPLEIVPRVDVCSRQGASVLGVTSYVLRKQHRKAGFVSSESTSCLLR